MEMTLNRIAIKEAFRKGEINAICGYPGIGKTYLTNQDSRFVDGWLSEHLYIDKSKGIRNPSFPFNYMNMVSDIRNKGKIIVTAMSLEARKVFEDMKMTYLVIYPQASEKERYFNIYDTRPDVREWISLNKTVWDDKIKMFQELKVPNNCFKDEIPSGMNLTDYLSKLEVLNKNRVKEMSIL